MASRIPGIELIRLAKLPKAPASASSRQECGALDAPKGDDGKAVAALGWGVTAEATLGGYQAVSFAGKFEAGTSGACDIDQGNVALFESGRLVVLIYAARNAKTSIGRIVSTKDGLRILDGDLVPMPVGDIHLAGDRTIEVVPLPREEAVCDGRGVVPNLYGKPITEVRKEIMAKGWTPLRGPPPSEPDAVAKDLQRLGIVEAVDCAGTGFAFCSYYYRQNDMELSVTSFGDRKPTVSAYHVACERAGWHKD